MIALEIGQNTVPTTQVISPIDGTNYQLREYLQLSLLVSGGYAIVVEIIPVVVVTASDLCALGASVGFCYCYLCSMRCLYGSCPCCCEVIFLKQKVYANVATLR